MIRTILGFFGYLKVPTEAIQLYMAVEDQIKLLGELLGKDNPTVKLHFEQQHEGMQQLTNFLRMYRSTFVGKKLFHSHTDYNTEPRFLDMED